MKVESASEEVPSEEGEDGASSVGPEKDFSGPRDVIFGVVTKRVAPAEVPPGVEVGDGENEPLLPSLRPRRRSSLVDVARCSVRRLLFSVSVSVQHALLLVPDPCLGSDPEGWAIHETDLNGSKESGGEEKPNTIDRLLVFRLVRLEGVEENEEDGEDDGEDSASEDDGRLGRKEEVGEREVEELGEGEEADVFQLDVECEPNDEGVQAEKEEKHERE